MPPGSPARFPVGAGLSSSAAFSVALLLALGHDPDPARAGPGPARRPSGAPARTSACSIRSPSLAPPPGTRLHIDFDTLETRLVPMPEQAAFVIVHSEVPRLLTEHPVRRPGGPSAGGPRTFWADRSARATLGDLSELTDPVLRRRARHVVTECARVGEAERMLARGNLSGVGAVMTEGHRSLAVDFRVSVPAVDELVDELLGQPGVLGARMSGGGFGGCVIALCRPDSPALDPEAHAPRRAWRISPAAAAVRLGT